MKSLNIERFPCFRNSNALLRLNRLAAREHNLMPHQVAVATGCTLTQAMALLLDLYHNSLAQAFLLVYHNRDKDDPLAPFEARDIRAGYPELPITCENCGEEIESPNELSYDFLFRLIDQVEFIA